MQLSLTWLWDNDSLLFLALSCQKFALLTVVKSFTPLTVCFKSIKFWTIKNHLFSLFSLSCLKRINTAELQFWQIVHVAKQTFKINIKHKNRNLFFVYISYPGIILVLWASKNLSKCTIHNLNLQTIPSVHCTSSSPVCYKECILTYYLVFVLC